MKMYYSTKIAEKLLDYKNEIKYVLDVGGGVGLFAEYITQHIEDCHVAMVEYNEKTEWDQLDKTRITIIKQNILDLDFDQEFDVVWASHVLEHMPNANHFLKLLKSALKPNGFLAITVPPLKHRIVGGHISLWNAGLLLYNLVLAGFDCSEAKILKYEGNISILLRKKEIELPLLKFGQDDLTTLQPYLPIKVDPQHFFEGDIEELNWNTI